MERYLTIILDTCALLWWSLDPDKLSAKAKITIEDMERSKNDITSAMAIWEIAIKVKNQKLDLGVPLSKYISLERMQIYKRESKYFTCHYFLLIYRSSWLIVAQPT